MSYSPMKARPHPSERLPPGCLSLSFSRHVRQGMKKLLAEVPEATTDGPGLESLERTKAVEELETVSEGV